MINCIFRNNLSNKEIEGFQSHDKTSWTREKLHIFCDICIEAIKKGMRSTTHFDKIG
jgi:hypothetical protein